MRVAVQIANDAQAAVTLDCGTPFAATTHDRRHCGCGVLNRSFDHRSTLLPIFKFDRFTRLRSDFANSFRNASRSAFVASNCRRMVSSTVSQRPAMCARGRFTHWPVAAP
jgi:hypothetical protein